MRVFVDKIKLLHNQMKQTKNTIKIFTLFTKQTPVSEKEAENKHMTQLSQKMRGLVNSLSYKTSIQSVLFLQDN